MFLTPRVLFFFNNYFYSIFNLDHFLCWSLSSLCIEQNRNTRSGNYEQTNTMSPYRALIIFSTTCWGSEVENWWTNYTNIYPRLGQSSLACLVFLLVAIECLLKLERVIWKVFGSLQHELLMSERRSNRNALFQSVFVSKKKVRASSHLRHNRI